VRCDLLFSVGKQKQILSQDLSY